MSEKERGMGMYGYSSLYGRNILFVLFLIVLAAGLALPGNASASEEGWAPGQDKWKFALGGFFPSIDTDLKINGVSPGDLINLEDKLGFDDSDSLFRLDGYWRFFRKHRLEFGYYEFNRDASVVLSEQIKIGDEVFPIDARASSNLDLAIYTIDYLYSFLQGEKWEIAGGLGAYWVDIAFSVGASLDVNNQPIVGGPFFESTDVNGPLPFLTLSFEYYITPKWLVLVKGGYFQLEVDDIDGKLITFGGKLEYQFTRMFGLGVGYDSFRIDADAEDGELIADIEYKFSGFQAYGILRF